MTGHIALLIAFIAVPLAIAIGVFAGHSAARAGTKTVWSPIAVGLSAYAGWWAHSALTLALDVMLSTASDWVYVPVHVGGLLIIEGLFVTAAVRRAYVCSWPTTFLYVATFLGYAAFVLILLILLGPNT